MMKFVDTVTIAKKLHKPFTHVEMPKIFLFNRGGPIFLSHLFHRMYK